MVLMKSIALTSLTTLLLNPFCQFQSFLKVKISSFLFSLTVFSKIFSVRQLNGNITNGTFKISPIYFTERQKTVFLQKMFIFETLTVDYQYFGSHYYISNINRFITLQKPLSLWQTNTHFHLSVKIPYYSKMILQFFFYFQAPNATSGCFAATTSSAFLTGGSAMAVLTVPTVPTNW